MRRVREGGMQWRKGAALRGSRRRMMVWEKCEVGKSVVGWLGGEQGVWVCSAWQRGMMVGLFFAGAGTD